MTTRLLPQLKQTLIRTMATTTPTKATMRKQIKHSLSSLTQNQITTQSHIAQQTILSLPQYTAANRIGIYLNMPNGEAQTELLVQDALQAGKAVFVPYLHKPDPAEKRKVMEMLRLESTEKLEPDAWGIPSLRGVEGRENAMVGEEGLDVIVVPAVAFDRMGNRLGHGAGFYDRFFEQGWGEGSERRKPFLVGLCLREQVLPEGQTLATKEWDWKVDAVAVGDGTLLMFKGS